MSGQQGKVGGGAVPLLLQLHARRELHVLPLQLPDLGVSGEWAAGQGSRGGEEEDAAPATSGQMAMRRIMEIHQISGTTNF